MGTRITSGIERGSPIQIEVDGRALQAYEGETIAAAMIASGITSFRHTAKHSSPRGIFCGMGVCFDCLMTVDGVPNVRSCITKVREGMKVRTQDEHAWGEHRDSLGEEHHG